MILAQSPVSVEPGDTIDTLYQKCFGVSAQTVLTALKKIESGDHSPVSNHYLDSYYSLPTKKHWQELRRRKVKFI